MVHLALTSQKAWENHKSSRTRLVYWCHSLWPFLNCFWPSNFRFYGWTNPKWLARMQDEFSAYFQNVLWLPMSSKLVFNSKSFFEKTTILPSDILWSLDQITRKEQNAYITKVGKNRLVGKCLRFCFFLHEYLRRWCYSLHLCKEASTKFPFQNHELLSQLFLFSALL